MTKEYRIDLERPNKRDVFLRIACDVATLSTDAQTICGCVLTTKDNRIISTGYNGYPRECNNNILPNIRPYKYQWFQEQHAEKNAVNNCVIRPKDIGGGIAYVTGESCFGCVCHLWNNHISEIWQLADFSKPRMVDKEDKYRTEEFVKHLDGKLKLYLVNSNFDLIDKRIGDSRTTIL